MMHIKIIFLLCFSSELLFAKTIETYGNKYRVRPFSSIAPRPPATFESVNLLPDLSFGLRSRSICGITDISTLTLDFPRELLSGKYWKQLGKELEKKALQQVTAISGALPMLLLQNLSPGLFNVLNKSFLEASSGLSLHMDTCKTLEGLSDVTKSQFESLRGCMETESAKDPKANSLLIREKCAIGGSTTASPREKFDYQAGKNKGYDHKSLLDISCSKMQSSQATQYKNLDFSRYKASCSLKAEFFPGLSIVGGAKVSTGGFSSSSERQYSEQIIDIRGYLLGLLDLTWELKYGKGRYKSQGPLPIHKILTHSSFLAKLGQDKLGKVKGYCYPGETSCRADSRGLPPIYLKSKMGEVPPVLLLNPGILVKIVETTPNNKPSMVYNNQLSSLSGVLDKLFAEIAYITLSPILKDRLFEIRSACKSAQMNSQAAQSDCALTISNLEKEIAALEMNHENQKKASQVQRDLLQDLSRMQPQVEFDSQSNGSSPVPLSDPKEF